MFQEPDEGRNAARTVLTSLGLDPSTVMGPCQPGAAVFNVGMGDTGEPSERQQVWHEYRMNHAINTAWLGYGISATQMYALEDAWDSLVVHQEWRDWHQAHLRGSSAFLYLAVRDGLPTRRLRKTPNGASLQLPATELAEAERDGTLIEVFRGVIRDLYARWAEGHGVAAPPELQPAT